MLVDSRHEPNDTVALPDAADFEDLMAHSECYRDLRHGEEAHHACLAAASAFRSRVQTALDNAEGIDDFVVDAFRLRLDDMPVLR